MEGSAHQFISLWRSLQVKIILHWHKLAFHVPSTVIAVLCLGYPTFSRRVPTYIILAVFDSAHLRMRSLSAKPHENFATSDLSRNYLGHRLHYLIPYLVAVRATFGIVRTQLTMMAAARAQLPYKQFAFGTGLVVAGVSTSETRAEAASPEKKEVDIYRNTALRYMGYCNEVRK